MARQQPTARADRAKTDEKRSDQTKSALAAVSGKLALSPPADLTDAEKEFWANCLEARSFGFWKQADVPVLREYIRAWSAVNKLEQELESEGMVRGGYPNAKLKALSLRFQHMTRMMFALGIAPSSRLDRGEKSPTRDEKNRSAREDALRSAASGRAPPPRGVVPRTPDRPPPDMSLIAGHDGGGDFGDTDDEER